MNADLVLFRKLSMKKSFFLLVHLRPSEVLSQSEPQRTEFTPIINEWMPLSTAACWFRLKHRFL